MESLACTYDRQAVLTACSITRTNYTFLGWNSLPDGSGTTYEDGTTFVNLTAQESAIVTLYVQWSRDSYSIIFIANDGTEFRRTTKAFSGEITTMPECSVEREGYTFSGWNTKEDGSGKSYAAGDEFTDIAEAGETITLYAMWNKNPDPVDPGTNPDTDYNGDATGSEEGALKATTMPATGDGAGSAGAALLVLTLASAVAVFLARRRESRR